MKKRRPEVGSGKGARLTYGDTMRTWVLCDRAVLIRSQG